MPETKEITAKRVLSDFKRAYEYKKKWLECAKEDVEFSLGKQWDDADYQKLMSINVRPLTINKIRPNIFLLTGIEAQNRTDYKAFPKGQEDGIKAEVTTACIKHVMERSEGEHKQSEQFEEGLMSGECYIQPYLDFTYDLINPDMRFTKVSADQIFPAPGCKEYDLSDAPHVFKFSPKLTKEQLLELFPGKDKIIDNLSTTKIDVVTWNNLKAEVHKQGTDYPQDSGNVSDIGEVEEKTYDLLECYYKKYVKKPIVIDRQKMQLIENIENKEAAEQYAESVNATAPGSIEIRYRYIPEIWVKSIVGNDIIEDAVSWTYPRWSGYPLFAFFVYRSTANVQNPELLVQGIARGMKDLNRDYNKRRTQELRHVNQSSNSGWQYEEGTLSPEQEEVYKKFGASPGVNLVHKQGKPAPTKIVPNPYPSAHAALAQERSQEMRESSGINADLLSMQEGQSSGRAIMLRQKQGLVMVQKIYDNFTRTKKMMAKFILTQLPELYDVESILKLMGEKWVLENFGQPVMQPQLDPMTGQPMIDPATGQLAMVPVMDGNKPKLDMTPEAQQMAMEAINLILNDKDMIKYDISVGEGVYAETAKAGNYLEIMGMVEKGLPIPPDVIVDESSLNQTSKDRIKKAIEAQQVQAALPSRM